LNKGILQKKIIDMKSLCLHGITQQQKENNNNNNQLDNIHAMMINNR